MKKYKLEDLCKEIIDCPHSTPNWKNEGVRVIRNFNIKNGRLDFSDGYFVDEDSYKERTRRAIPEANDLVISREAPMGAVCIIPENLKCCLGQRLVLLKIDNSICDSKYLLFSIQSDYVQKQIEVINKTGSIVSNLNISDLKKLMIPYRSLSIQQKITAVLSSLDDKIALNNRINAKLEQMAKRLYDYWFVQFGFPGADGKPYKSNGGKMVWNEELKREIPEGWEVRKVKDVIAPIERGLSYSSDDILDPTGKPMINLACFDKSGNYRTGELKYYSGNYSDTGLLAPMDILIACTDLTQKADIIGTPIFVSNEYDNFVYSTDLAKLTPKDSANKFYLYYYLKNDTFHRYIKPYASGTTVKHLNLNGVLEYPYIQPNEEVISSFNRLIEPIRKEIINLQTDNVKLTKLKDKLLPLLMNGQVVVEV